MSEYRRRMFCLVILILGCLLAPPSLAVDKIAEASSAKPERDWSVDFTPYLWIVGIDADIGIGPIEDAMGVGIISLLEHLKGMAMADLAVRYKRVGIFGDGMWAAVTDSSFTPALRASIVNTDIRLSLAFGSGGAFYRFHPMKGLALDPYIAARWWRVHTTATFVDIGGVLPPKSSDTVVTWADPVFGLKASYDITEKWSFKALADVGGGVSKVSWQALVGGGYRFTPWFGVELVYRVMGVDYEPNSFEKIELKLNGLVLGFNFHY